MKNLYLTDSVSKEKFIFRHAENSPESAEKVGKKALEILGFPSQGVDSESLWNAMKDKTLGEWKSEFKWTQNKAKEDAPHGSDPRLVRGNWASIESLLLVNDVGSSNLSEERKNLLDYTRMDQEALDLWIKSFYKRIKNGNDRLTLEAYVERQLSLKKQKKELTRTKEEIKQTSGCYVVEKGDTLGEIVSNLVKGKREPRFSWSLPVDYRDRGRLTSRGKKIPKQLNQANWIYPGQYVWIEGRTVVVSKRPPTGSQTEKPSSQKPPAKKEKQQETGQVQQIRPPEGRAIETIIPDAIRKYTKKLNAISITEPSDPSQEFPEFTGRYNLLIRKCHALAIGKQIIFQKIKKHPADDHDFTDIRDAINSLKTKANAFNGEKEAFEAEIESKRLEKRKESLPRRIQKLSPIDLKDFELPDWINNLSPQASEQIYALEKYPGLKDRYEATKTTIEALNTAIQELKNADIQSLVEPQEITAVETIVQGYESKKQELAMAKETIEEEIEAVKKLVLGYTANLWPTGVPLSFPPKPSSKNKVTTSSKFVVKENPQVDISHRYVLQGKGEKNHSVRFGELLGGLLRQKMEATEKREGKKKTKVYSPLDRFFDFLNNKNAPRELKKEPIPIELAEAFLHLDIGPDLKIERSNQQDLNETRSWGDWNGLQYKISFDNGKTWGYFDNYAELLPIVKKREKSKTSNKK